jgi:hypothetical protein
MLASKRALAVLVDFCASLQAEGTSSTATHFFPDAAF